MADQVLPAMGRAMGDPPKPGAPIEPAEDDWKIPVGPVDELEQEPTPEPVHAGSLLHRLTHRG